MPKIIIDWNQAKSQCGGDEELLSEVIEDFMTEAESARIAFESAMKSKNFLSVEQEAHKIKGTASYLYCPELVSVSLKLQEKGHEGVAAEKADKSGNHAKLWNDVEQLYNNYMNAFREFKSEVSSKGYSHK